MKTATQIEKLKAYLIILQKWYDQSVELVLGDLPPEPDEPPQTNEKEEQIARIADAYGFDGALFRREIRDKNPFSAKSMKRLTKKIETIPKIIAAIEKPIDKSSIPKDAELLTVEQLAHKLNMGVSVVREKNNKGLIPEPIRIGNSGTLYWPNKEIEHWIENRCPSRQVWERNKKQREEAV